MRRSRFTDEQIVGILKAADVGGDAAEVCRRNGISSESVNRWRKKFGGVEVNEAKRLRQLEDENPQPPPEAAQQSLFAPTTALVRRVIGVPDYDIYRKHMAVCHPGAELLSERDFAEERVRDKYSKPGQRCC